MAPKGPNNRRRGAKEAVSKCDLRGEEQNAAANICRYHGSRRGNTHI